METPADWRPDPSGRHDYRYWDGQQWTEHVADSGQASIDPLPADFTTPPDAAPPPPDAGPTAADAGPTAPQQPTVGQATPWSGGQGAPPGAVWTTPAAGQPAGAGLAPAVQQTNGLAIASLVLGIVWVYWIGSILAVIFGHVAMRQFRNEPGRYTGRGMAVAGLVLGYIGVGILGLFLLIGITAGFAGF